MSNKTNYVTSVILHMRWVGVTVQLMRPLRHLHGLLELTMEDFAESRKSIGTGINSSKMRKFEPSITMMSFLPRGQWTLWEFRINMKWKSMIITSLYFFLDSSPKGTYYTPPFIPAHFLNMPFESLNFLTALLRYNLQAIKFIHYNCTIQWFFNKFTELCSHPHNPALEHFHQPK